MTNLQNPAPPAATAAWHPGPLLDQAGLLGVRVGAWNHHEYPENTPAAGEHWAVAITAAHDAVGTIDEIIRDLHELRSALVSEIRQDSDASAARVDAMLAESAARKAGAGDGSWRGKRVSDMTGAEIADMAGGAR